MLPGPVFKRELRMASKRRVVFIDRATSPMMVVAMMIAVALIWYYLEWERESLEGIRRFSLAVFGVAVVLMGTGILGLTTSAVSTIIAGERDRKSLDAVLASRLTSAEIVLGALSAGLVRSLSGIVAVFPVLLLMVPFGGIDLRLLLLGYAGLMSTAFVIGATSVFASVIARNSRRAAAHSLLSSAWMFFPVVIVILFPKIWPAGARFMHPLMMALVESGPMAIAFSSIGPFGRRTLLEAVIRMIEGEFVISLVAIALAIYWLRPASRTVYDAEGRSALMKMLRVRKKKRPPCGDDPVLWQEMHSLRGAKNWEILVGRTILLFFMIMLGYGTYVVAKPAFLELFLLGYGPTPSSALPTGESPFVRAVLTFNTGGPPLGTARFEFNQALRLFSGFFWMLFFLMISGFAGESVVLEKERETWLGLIATPLSGSEILRAKMLGTLWRVRLSIVVTVGLWLLGLLSGAVHPLGFLVTILGLVISSWFLTSLGIYGAVWSRNRAEVNNKIVWPGLLMSLTGLLLVQFPGWSPHVWLGSLSMPVVGWLSLFSYDDVRALIGHQPFPGLGGIGARSGETGFSVCVTLIVGLSTQLIAALVLTRAAIRDFDIAAGRPRESGSNPVVPT